MTKPRDPATFEDAAIEALHILGADEVARAIGLTAGAVRKYADPEAAGRPIVHHTLTIDAACHAKAGRMPFLSAYQHQARLLSGDRAPGDVVMEALDVTSAVGNLSQHVRAARDTAGEGGAALTTNERVALLRQIADVRKELDQLEDAVRIGGAR